MSYGENILNGNVFLTLFCQEVDCSPLICLLSYGVCVALAISQRLNWVCGVKCKWKSVSCTAGMAPLCLPEAAKSVGMVSLTTMSFFTRWESVIANAYTVRQVARRAYQTVVIPT